MTRLSTADVVSARHRATCSVCRRRRICTKYEWTHRGNFGAEVTLCDECSVRWYDGTLREAVEAASARNGSKVAEP